MHGRNSLPTTLPMHVRQLILELDEIINPVEITDPSQLADSELTTLAFNAGRRSVVTELKRLLDTEEK